MSGFAICNNCQMSFLSACYDHVFPSEPYDKMPSRLSILPSPSVSPTVNKVGYRHNHRPFRLSFSRFATSLNEQCWHFESALNVKIQFLRIRMGTSVGASLNVDEMYQFYNHYVIKIFYVKSACVFKVQQCNADLKTDLCGSENGLPARVEYTSKQCDNIYHLSYVGTHWWNYTILIGKTRYSPYLCTYQF